MSINPEWMKADLRDMAKICDEMGLSATAKTIEDAISLLSLELHHRNVTHPGAANQRNQ